MCITNELLLVELVLVDFKLVDTLASTHWTWYQLVLNRLSCGFEQILVDK